MTITADFLEKKWSSVTYYEGGFIRLESSHMLEWYAGYQSIEQKTLMIVSNFEITAPPQTKSVIATSRRREIDGKWTLTFELVRNEQDSVFINLCCDIFNYSINAFDEKEALRLVLNRYKQWSRLLEYQKSAVLEEGSRKGLLGELIFLQTKLKDGIAPLSVLQAWGGPCGADQDFSFANGWYEVKTIGAAADSVRISSLQQLDSPNAGNLVIVRIDKCSPERQGAFSLFQKVTEIREAIRQEINAAELFEEKLEMCGYMDLTEYNSQKYYYSGKKIYIVNDTFPKLSSKTVPPQVIASEYTLSIAGILPWEI